MKALSLSLCSKGQHISWGLLLCLISFGSWGVDLPKPKWHGYVSQGFVKTSDNSFFGDSEDVSWEFTDVAVGLSWRPVPKVQMSAQALYRQAGATSRDDIYTDYAVIDFHLIDDLTKQIGVRAGRIKNPYGFYNDTRDIAASRPSVLLPESIYLDPQRDVYHTSDSVSAYANWYLGEHFFQFDILHGKPLFTTAVQNEFLLPAGISGELNNEEIDLRRLLIESYGGKLRLAYTNARLRTEFVPDPGERDITIAPGETITVPINGYPGHTVTKIHLYSAEFNHNNWQFTTEFQNLTLIRQDSSPTGRANQPSRSFYLSGSYRINEKYQVYARRDIYYANKDDKNGDDFAQASGRPAHNRYAYDTTIGLQYQVNKSWHFATEFHHVRGTAWLSNNENYLPDTTRDWSMLTAKMSYQF